MLTGSCLCGAVRYEADGVPYHRTVCHCAMCRRASGAPMVAWFSVARGALRWVRGQPRSYRSSGHATRCFCAVCGTQLTFAADAYPDDPERAPPSDHTRTSSRLSWVGLDDGLPQHIEARPDR
jgi:hypothetical protein